MCHVNVSCLVFVVLSLLLLFNVFVQFYIVNTQYKSILFLRCDGICARRDEDKRDYMNQTVESAFFSLNYYSL